MAIRSSSTPPPAFAWIWLAAALAAAGGLISEFGFHEPLLEPRYALRFLFMGAGAVFVASRIVLLFPASELSARLQHWWMDYVLIVAGCVWWAIEPFREPIILRVTAIYILATGTVAGIYVTLSALIDRVLTGRSLMARLFAALVVGALVGGAVLSLPACWSAPVIGQKDSQYWMHILDCTFTAVAALTCTGLTPLDIGRDFTMPGHLALIVLMQVGGLVALLIGTAVGVRLRIAVAGTARDNPNGGADTIQLRTILRAIVVLALAIECAGAAVLFYPELHTTAPLSQRLVMAVFQSVSAFCNVGLTFSHSSLMGAHSEWVFAVILPLMILGSIGAPPLLELRRRRRTDDAEPRLTGAVKTTLWGTAVLIVLGAALLWTFESTRHWQLRYPRQNTPGRLMVAQASQPQTGETPQNFRLSEQSVAYRAEASLFTSTAARSGGFQIMRLDETSITPSSRWLLMLLMLVGGGLGGTAGGVRITTMWACLRGLVKGFLPREEAGAYRVAAGMLLLIAGTTMILLYRDVGSFESSLFEATSACCNVGFSGGLTRQLYVEAKIALILAMLIGRTIPLALLTWDADAARSFSRK